MRITHPILKQPYIIDSNNLDNFSIYDLKVLLTKQIGCVRVENIKLFHCGKELLNFDQIDPELPISMAIVPIKCHAH